MTSSQVIYENLQFHNLKYVSKKHVGSSFWIEIFSNINATLRKEKNV
jgi:hypothetical protein